MASPICLFNGQAVNWSITTVHKQTQSQPFSPTGYQDIRLRHASTKGPSEGVCEGEEGAQEGVHGEQGARILSGAPRDELYKIGLPGKLILIKRTGLGGSHILLKIVSENQFSGKTYFYAIASSPRSPLPLHRRLRLPQLKTQDLRGPVCPHKGRKRQEVVRQIQFQVPNPNHHFNL